MQKLLVTPGATLEHLAAESRNACINTPCDQLLLVLLHPLAYCYAAGFLPFCCWCASSLQSKVQHAAQQATVSSCKTLRHSFEHTGCASVLIAACIAGIATSTAFATFPPEGLGRSGRVPHLAMQLNGTEQLSR